MSVTGWSSTTLTTPGVDAGYARSTTVDAGLPRTTGFEGAVAADVHTPRAPVVAGQQYVWSVSVKANADLLSPGSNMIVNFYSSLTSGGFISNSGPTVQMNLAAGQVGRFVLGPYTVPAGAVASLLKLNDLGGACEITGYRVAQFSGNLTSDGAYFDGFSAGWSWDGTPDLTSSSGRVFEETFSFTDSFSLLSTASGPVGADQITFAESFSLAVSGGIADSFLFRDGFLIAELEFDETRGRIRVQAFTFGPLVTQVRVQRRAVASGRYVDVRGGTVPVLGGYMTRPVDDYEYPAGVDMAYAIQGLNDQGAVVQAATVYRSGGDDRAWLKFIANPVLNQPITLLTDFDGVEREARTGLFEVQGRRDPIAVTDVHSSRRMTIRVKTETPAETAALDQALSLGIPCFVQVPAGIPVPTVYASIGSYRWQPPTKRSKRSIFEIPLVEIAAPHPSIMGAFATWQSVLEAHTSWEDLYFRNATWRHVASGDHEAVADTGGGTGQASLQTSPAPPPVSPPPSTPQRVGWPAYVYPTIGTHWARYFANARPDDVLIANPASGPGSTVDSTYTAVIAQAQSLGIKVFGYVDTSYKAVSLATVEGHVDGWMTLYGNVDGIFVDQVTSTGSDVATYYQPLYNYIKTATGNRLVVLNPGTDCDEQFMNCSDIIMNFENTAAQYPVRVVRAWEENYSIYRFWHSIHTITSTSQRDTILALTRGYRAGYIYLTDDDMSVLPYDSLPTDPWWPDLIAQL